MDGSSVMNLLWIGLVVLVAIYYLRKENNKTASYFGGKESMSKNELMQLKHYKSIYTPLPADKRLPNFARDKFELEDIAYTATQMAFDYPLPGAEQKKELKSGDLVKLLFMDKGGDVERMWVEVMSTEGGLYQGMLRNDAFTFKNIKEGMVLYFHANHIFDIKNQK